MTRGLQRQNRFKRLPGIQMVAGKPVVFVWLVLGVAVLLFGSGGCASRRPFYPIGIYSVPTEEGMRQVRQAGFTVITGPAEAAYLDRAHRLGLRVLAAPGTSARDFDALKARTAVKALDDHPALWGWYLVDEPDLHGVPPEDVRDAHRFLKSIGARKPTALVLFYGSEALHYASIADITMIDRYPVPWMPVAHFSQHVRMVRLALGTGKPMVAVVQAFDWSNYPHLFQSTQELRPPLYAEIRSMTFSALVHQATGIFYYCFDDGRWSQLEHPETWDALRRVVQEIHDLTPLFQAEHVWYDHAHKIVEREKDYSEALEASITPALLRVRRGSRSVPAGEYLLTVNSTPWHLNYSYRLPQQRDGTVAVLGENRRLNVQDSWITDHFDPFAVHVYGPLEDADGPGLIPLR